MAYMRGLELVCIGRRRSFEIRYENGRYVDLAGRQVEGLLDMTCYFCSASYYTLEGDEEIEFCPNCGRFERRHFESLPDLLEWARGQNFDFLRFSGQKAFGVQGASGWQLAFAPDTETLRRRGFKGEIHLIASEG